MKEIKALVMFSGGLDSTLALRILQEQDVTVEAVHFSGVFHAGKFKERESYVKKVTDRFGIKVSAFDMGEDFIDILKNPRYGYGRNLNPCIDCRIYTLKKAKAYMDEAKAQFIATGEVLGQRPMSQRKDMLHVVEKRSGLEGALLRPLSAKLLPTTLPEEKGWVDRSRLFDISGRSRKRQMELARQFNIKDYPNPAGGCLLTDPQYTERLRDLIKHDNVTNDDMELLKYGRHFRISDHAKVIVGRNKLDNETMLNLVRKGDVILKLKNIPGPLTIVRGQASDKDIITAAELTARYAKPQHNPRLEVMYHVATSKIKVTDENILREMTKSVSVTPMDHIAADRVVI